MARKEAKFDEDFEEDYKLGFLTEKGYKFKKGMRELDKELEEGDLTQQGYIKKKKQLLEEFSQVTTPAHSAGSTSVITKSLDDMKSPSVHVYAHLNKLFNKKAVSKRSLAKTKRRKVESSHDDSDEEAVTPITKKSREKAVTVVCVDPGTTTIPRQKHKRGSMKYLLVSPTDSEEIISRNIRKLFDFDVIVLRATMSNDLFEQKDPINGRKLLDMIGNGCLYVKPSSVPNKSDISEIQLPKPTQVVYPSSADKPDINLELLKKELSDSSLILSYKMDSESYSTDTYENESLEEGTVQSDISCGSG